MRLVKTVEFWSVASAGALTLLFLSPFALAQDVIMPQWPGGSTGVELYDKFEWIPGTEDRRCIVAVLTSIADHVPAPAPDSVCAKAVHEAVEIQEEYERTHRASVRIGDSTVQTDDMCAEMVEASLEYHRTVVTGDNVCNKTIREAVEIQKAHPESSYSPRLPRPLARRTPAIH